MISSPRHTRRRFLQAAAVAPLLVAGSPALLAAKPPPLRTRFQLACMTLPYSQFPLARALSGIKGAGYSYVAWGTTHLENRVSVPVLAAQAPPDQARQLAVRCRDAGLEPLLMFSVIYPEADGAEELFRNRIAQAGAAEIGQLLTFGHTKGDHHRTWVDRLRRLGPVAADHNVMIVIKQHGGTTGTGEACAKIAQEIDHPQVKVNYDAGNVMDYLDLDPIADLKKCSGDVRSFCIKDHRNFPQDEDCGPGFGEIDHYKLLQLVAFSSLTIPLCFENIFAPLLPRPTDPADIDVLARRAREFIETAVAGIQR